MRERIKGKTEGEIHARVGEEVVKATAGLRRAAAQGPIGLDELNRLGKPHGIRFFDDWIRDLKAAYAQAALDARSKQRAIERREGGLPCSGQRPEFLPFAAHLSSLGRLGNRLTGNRRFDNHSQ